MSQILSVLPKKIKGMKFCVADVEAVEWTNPIVVGFFDGNKYRHFETMQDFLKFYFRQKYANYKCFFHWGGGYDFNFIFDTMHNYFQDIAWSCLDNNGVHFISMKSPDKKRVWHFSDSYKLLPASLHTLTNDFDVEHKKLVEFDRGNLQKIPVADVIRYNEYDCRGLYEVLEKFQTWFNGIGVDMKTTVASQALATWRRMMPFNMTTLDEYSESFIRKGYFGGRVEIFKMKCFDKFYYYDFTSLYPYVMKKYDMPVGKPMETSEFQEDKIGFYEVEVSVPDMYIPVLPFIMDGKLIFPTGNFRGIFSSEEIKFARSLGCEFKIKYGYVFDGAKIFDEYIDRFFELKNTSQGSTKMISKLLLNSLYGKFAQKRDRENIVRIVDPSEVSGTKPYMEEFGLYKKFSFSKANYIIPSISAWITSCARVELAKMLYEAGQQNIYYADTDSICSTKKLPTGKNLGDLKLEMTGLEAIFLLPKTYAIRTDSGLIIKAKGFEREFTAKLTMNSFDKALNGDASDFNQNLLRFGKFKECLRRNGQFVSMLQKKKSIQSVYTKREVLENLDTRPLRVSVPLIS